MDKGKILVLDNADYLLSTYKYLLERDGYDITFVSKDKEAIELLEKEDYDLLLFDIPHAPFDSEMFFMKSALDDLEIIHKRHPKLPIIALSTEPNIYRADIEFRELGVVKGIEKPFEAKILSESVKEALKKKG